MAAWRIRYNPNTTLVKIVETNNFGIALYFVVINDHVTYINRRLVVLSRSKLNVNYSVKTVPMTARRHVLKTGWGRFYLIRFTSH